MGFVSSTVISSLVLCTFSHSDITHDLLEYAQDSLQSTYGDIIFSAMVFRHGDPNKVATFPNNPYTDYFIKGGLAQLTTNGKKRSKELGRWARARYNRLLQNMEYRSSLFNVVSSNDDRSINSAKLFLTGFWEGLSEETFVITNFDQIMFTNGYCARFNLEVERMKFSSTLMQEFYQKHKEMFDYIEQHTDITIPRDDMPKTIEVIAEFYYNLYIQERTLNLTKKFYPYPVQETAVMYFKSHIFDDEVQRLKGGPLLNHITSELKNKRDYPQAEKLFQFYSGHDGTLIALLSILGVYDGKPAEYSASILFELRKFNQNYIVTVSYKNSERSPPQLLHITGCDNPCSLEDFIRATHSVIPEDRVNNCDHLKDHYSTLLLL